MATINKTGLEGKESFLGFWFNGRHSSEFRIIRVSGGKEFEEELLPTAKDTIIDIPGRDGSEFIQAKREKKQFKIDFSFDDLYEKDIRVMKQWLGVKNPCELIFDERPYKVWTGKVTTAPKINFVPFDDTEKGVVYKGKGSITFTCFKPYARSKSKNLNDYCSGLNYDLTGKATGQQVPFDYRDNKKDWAETSGIQETDPNTNFTGKEGYLYNYGDIPVAPILTIDIVNTSDNYLSLSYQGSIKMILDLNVLRAIFKGDNIVSKPIIIDNEMHLILDGRESETTSKQTEKIYNNAIVAGDFFQLDAEEGEFVVYGGNLTKVEYDYLYY